MNNLLPSTDDHALSAAYRSRMDSFEPKEVVIVPVHHLLANTETMSIPSGVSRDWRKLAQAHYQEHFLINTHHQVLNASHVANTATCLHAILLANQSQGKMLN